METYLIFGTVTPDLVPGSTWGLTPNIIRVSYPKFNRSLSLGLSRWTYNIYSYDENIR